ncbi:MAG: HAD family hydrolase [Bacilli bacterium]|nr:HAD family hydrolase [Bacilli bacterium]
MKKRIVFEVDDVLLTKEPHTDEEYFTDVFGDFAYPVLINLKGSLKEYEKLNPFYDYQSLSSFLTYKTGIEINKRVIKDWVEIIGNTVDYMNQEAEVILEELKERGYDLAVLTNWFEESQIPRLKNSGLYSYFDEIITGSKALKPHRIAYDLANGYYTPEEVVYIGNDIYNDYIKPKSYGADAILYDKDDNHHKTIKKVKSLSEIKRYI